MIRNIVIVILLCTLVWAGFLRRIDTNTISAFKHDQAVIQEQLDKADFATANQLRLCEASRSEDSVKLHSFEVSIHSLEAQIATPKVKPVGPTADDFILDWIRSSVDYDVATTPMMFLKNIHFFKGEVRIKLTGALGKITEAKNTDDGSLYSIQLKNGAFLKNVNEWEIEEIKSIPKLTPTPQPKEPTEREKCLANFPLDWCQGL